LEGSGERSENLLIEGDTKMRVLPEKQLPGEREKTPVSASGEDSENGGRYSPKQEKTKMVCYNPAKSDNVKGKGRESASCSREKVEPYV